jgi:hypothetical protein
MSEQLREDLLHILQHSLGLDEHGLYKGAREGYRNHYCTGPDCDSYAPCRELVEMGLMVEHPPREWLKYSTFVVTERGREVVAEQSPPAPKLTRSQRRYRRFLREDSSLSFREWLRVDAARQVRA